MGAITFSIDASLVDRLREVVPLEVFVETGTFEGAAIDQMISRFESLHTVELADELFDRAARRFHKVESVTVHHGDSRQVLKRLRPTLDGRAVLYWLDAHWCGVPGEDTQASQCPLLGELDALGPLHRHSVVLIDDARLFLAPPPLPHDLGDWPRFAKVSERLHALSSMHELMVINDVIVFFPPLALAALTDYSRTHGFDLLATVHRLDQLEMERHTLIATADERLMTIEEKEREIRVLARAADERLATIERLTLQPTEEVDSSHRDPGQSGSP